MDNKVDYLIVIVAAAILIIVAAALAQSVFDYKMISECSKDYKPYKCVAMIRGGLQTGLESE